MSLHDYDRDIQYLQEGRHPCTIKAVRMFEYTSKSLGAEFALVSGGAQTKMSFCLKESILWRLANFAKAAGLSKAQMSRIDEKTGKGLGTLVGCKVGVVVELKGKYHEGVEFYPLGGPEPPTADQQAEPSTPSTEADRNDDSDNAIPADDDKDILF